MITDEQYKILEKRVSELENKLASLSRHLSAAHMREDMAGYEQKQVVPNSKKKDTTKYLFDGKELCKRRLVLECVKKFVDDRSVKESKTLREAFPDYVQGSLGIVRSVDEAEHYSDANLRFYYGDGDIIRLKDQSMVVCSQWDVKNITRFIKLMNDYGYPIRAIERQY